MIRACFVCKMHSINFTDAQRQLYGFGFCEEFGLGSCIALFLAFRVEYPSISSRNAKANTCKSMEASAVLVHIGRNFELVKDFDSFEMKNESGVEKSKTPKRAVDTWQGNPGGKRWLGAGSWEPPGNHLGTIVINIFLKLNHPTRPGAALSSLTSALPPSQVTREGWHYQFESKTSEKVFIPNSETVHSLKNYFQVENKMCMQPTGKTAI
jgi:hypothetical protein